VPAASMAGRCLRSRGACARRRSLMAGMSAH
jgi:hypothetical protein